MPSEESTGTLARLDLVSFPLEHLCYFKLSVQRWKKKKKKKKEENRFPFANGSVKHISAAVRAEESGIITPTWKEIHPPPHWWQREASNSALLAPACSTEQPSKAQYLVCCALDF